MGSSPPIKSSLNSDYLLVKSEITNPIPISMRIFQQELEGLDSISKFDYYYPEDNLHNIIGKLKFNT